jgi:SNF2 family DNA or RNA helicase
VGAVPAASALAQNPAAPAPGGRLFIWGESPERLGLKLRGRKGPFPGHPFQASATELMQAFALLVETAGCRENRNRSRIGSAAGPDAVRASARLVQRPRKSHALMLLPAKEGYPIPSPALLLQARRVLPTARLERWTANGESAGPLSADFVQVTGVSVPALDVIRLLTVLPQSCRDDGGDDPSVRCDPFGRLKLAATPGSDFLYWAQASKLALELMARQRFVPDICASPDDSQARAVWRPLWESAQDVSRFRALADAMPLLCRAVWPVEQSDLARIAPSDVILRSFIDTSMDETIRGMLAMERNIRWADSIARQEFDDAERRLLEMAKLSNKRPACAWICSLNKEKPEIRLEPARLDSVRRGVNDWMAAASLCQTPTSCVPSVSAASGFRTCFRLESPDTGADSADPECVTDSGADVWTLHYYLQAADDPSVLVPAARVWEESGGMLRFLGRRFENPHERLLADLGQAARYFPAIETSLDTATPESCELTTAEAYSFLREVSPQLEQLGLGVLTPPWWERVSGGTARLGVRLKVQTDLAQDAGVGQANIVPRFSLDSLVDYDWQAALGDEVMSKDEFRRLADLKVPLVRVRGEWVEINPGEVESAIAFWEQRARRRDLTVRDVLTMSLAGANEEADAGAVAKAVAIGPEVDRRAGEAGLPVVGIEMDEALADLTSRLTTGERVEELPEPRTFNGALRPYQIRGLSWLAFLERWGLGACLADDMGLGKTIQLIALLLRAKEEGALRAPTLLVCPTSVVGNWHRELARFGPSLEVMVHHGPTRLAADDFAQAAAACDVVLTTYALLPRDEPTLSQIRWNAVVLDEAQNIKNPEAKQSRSARSLTAGFRVALTGTPVENRLSELWSIMDFLNPGYLGSFADFRQRYAIPIERYRDAKASSRLRSLTRPFILRRVKTDPRIIQDLPEKQEAKVYPSFTREQVTLYEAVVRDMLARIQGASGMERRGIILSTLLKLKQVCNHPAQFLHDKSSLDNRSGKLTRLAEMLEEAIGEGDRALVFTQFAEMGSMLQTYLSRTLGCEVSFLHGGVPQKARDKMVQRFQNDPSGPPVFILSLKAGGTGLNLTRASYVFHFDRWWNPAVENQATDRAFRIGQTKNVHVYKFVTAGTVEERIDQLIEEKKALSEEIIGAGEDWITEMSTDQLRDLFVLRRESLAEEEEAQ